MVCRDRGGTRGGGCPRRPRVVRVRGRVIIIIPGMMLGTQRLMLGTQWRGGLGAGHGLLVGVVTSRAAVCDIRGCAVVSRPRCHLSNFP